MAQSGYTPIQLYYSTTASATPNAVNLNNGELAVNITDGKLYYKDNGGVVKLLASNSGSTGDVVGPASATDNAVVRFDGATGKLVQNSAVTIADTTGNITAGTYNKVTITAPSTSATLTVANGKTLTANSTLTLAGVDSKTLTVNNSLTLAGTDATTMTFPSTSTTVAGLGTTQTFTGVNTFTPAARSSGTASYFTLTTPADTGQTASTEVIGANFTAATRSWATGALTLQRERVFAAPTYAFSGASTLTTAINVDIAVPVAGSNATITNAWALRAAASQFTGTVQVTGLTASKPVFTDANDNLVSTGTVPVDQGGTGQTSYAVGDILYANTTTSLAKLADVATGNALISGGVGVAPAWGKIGLTTHVSGTLPIANGGTGATTDSGARTNLGATTVGSNFFTLTNPSAITFPRINADNTVSALDAATFRTAIGAGTGGGSVTSVSFTGGIVSVANPTTTPALTVAGSSGGIPYFSSASTWASSAALAANAIVLGGGAGAAPATTTTGTGVVTAVGNDVNTSGGLVTQSGTLAASSLLLGGGASTAISSTTTGTGVVTALGVNTGTAGAFVVNGGALGTPSSGTVTNLTGTASININGTVGATTANTGAFTSVTSTSASGILTRAAATQDGVALVGRAGGTSSYEVTLTPTTLSADRTLTLPDASGTILHSGTAVTVAQGGTGQTTYTDGQLLIGNTTGNTLTKATLTAGSGVTITNGAGSISISATGSGGTVTSVSFTGGIVSVANSTTTPALTVAGTSGGIPYFSSASTWASSAALAANALVIGGGAGVAPSTTTTGTGVVTALGVNTGTAGAFVVNGGALGTPSSGTVTNLTGTASININGTVGATTPSTGAFTTLTASTNLSSTRINPRVSSTASASSVTPDIASYDIYAFTALAAGLTINAPTGTPVDGNKLIFRILDNGTSRSLTWNATYTPVGFALPSATTINKTTYVGCIYNANNTRWDVVAVTTQA